MLFLMYYASPLAPYYLQIEDDLSFANNWVQKISDYLSQEYPQGWLSRENTPWRLIDFSELGFIGKMFQSNELVRMAQYLLLFYDQMPCDLLLGEWMKSMTQGKRIAYWKQRQSLFQHVGVFRTLGGFQPLQETKFGKALFDNPPAKVVTSFTDIVPSYDPKYVYWPGGNEENRNDVCDYKAPPQHKRCWLWAKNVKEGDTVELKFEADVEAKALLVEFGAPKHEKDMLESVAVEVGEISSIFDGEVKCDMFHTIVTAEFQKVIYWEQGVSQPKDLPIAKFRCLRVRSLRAQQTWAIVWQFLVRTVGPGR